VYRGLLAALHEERRGLQPTNLSSLSKIVGHLFQLDDLFLSPSQRSSFPVSRHRPHHTSPPLPRCHQHPPPASPQPPLLLELRPLSVYRCPRLSSTPPPPPAPMLVSAHGVPAYNTGAGKELHDMVVLGACRVPRPRQSRHSPALDKHRQRTLTTGMNEDADGRTLRRRPNVGAVGVGGLQESSPKRPSA
jgi:hypothetical protein